MIGVTKSLQPLSDTLDNVAAALASGEITRECVVAWADPEGCTIVSSTFEVAKREAARRRVTLHRVSDLPGKPTVCDGAPLYVTRPLEGPR